MGILTRKFKCKPIYFIGDSEPDLLDILHIVEFEDRYLLCDTSEAGLDGLSKALKTISEKTEKGRYLKSWRLYELLPRFPVECPIKTTGTDRKSAFIKEHEIGTWGDLVKIIKETKGKKK
jgi:hypothetical protein